MLEGLREDSCTANKIEKYKDVKTAIEGLDRCLKAIKTKGATDEEYSSFDEMFDELDTLHTRMSDMKTSMEEDEAYNDEE